MKYTDVAWDFDGTLLDTYPNLVRAFKEALNSYGYTAEEDEIREKMSITIRHAVTYYAEKYGLDPVELRERAGASITPTGSPGRRGRILRWEV